MFRRLDDAKSLTTNQMKIVAAAIIGDFFYDGGFGGIGKIIGPLGLALIVGTSDIVTPKATLDAIVPSFMYFTAWLVLCGCAFLFFGFETGKQSISAIDGALNDATPAGAGTHK